MSTTDTRPGNTVQGKAKQPAAKGYASELEMRLENAINTMFEHQTLCMEICSDKLRMNHPANRTFYRRFDPVYDAVNRSKPDAPVTEEQYNKTRHSEDAWTWLQDYTGNRIGGLQRFLSHRQAIPSNTALGAEPQHSEQAALLSERAEDFLNRLSPPDFVVRELRAKRPTKDKLNGRTEFGFYDMVAWHFSTALVEDRGRSSSEIEQLRGQAIEALHAVRNDIDSIRGILKEFVEYYNGRAAALGQANAQDTAPAHGPHAFAVTQSRAPSGDRIVDPASGEANGMA